MRVAIVGCGFVADYYVRTFSAHPHLQIAGVADRDSERLERFSKHHALRAYGSFDDVLADPNVDIVLNITNPASHFEISRRSLMAGKHVYSEKPLAMKLEEAQELVALAERNERLICSAPCSILGETAQTVWKALRENRVGKVRIVYAELDDGPVHRMPYTHWLSESGTPWPYRDEFEVGCTLEHAGYYLTWLVAFFGPAVSITAFSSCLVPDKGTQQSAEQIAPDFTVGCIQFASGVVARLTCSIVAPHDHTLMVVGDEGVLGTKDCWHYQSPVYTQRMMTIRRRTFLNPWRRRYPLVKSGLQRQVNRKGSQQMDFSRGVAEMADAIREKRKCRISPQFSLHVLEMTLAIQNAFQNSSTYHMVTKSDEMCPMPWAK